MIYLGSTFNRIPAFQRVGGWMVACINGEVPAAAEKELQLFLFRASGAYWSLCQMEELSSQCFEEYEKAHAEESPSGDESQYFRFTSSSVVKLLCTFPVFFMNIVQMQDKILRVIQSTFPERVQQTPKNLNSSKRKAAGGAAQLGAQPRAWVCPNCGASNPTAGRFCQQCGGPRQGAEGWSCLGCGCVNVVGEFCQRCGAPRPNREKQ